MLQKHKFRRPKYMNIPGSLCDDPRWIKLSPEAAKALVTILLIAGENRYNSLPNPEMLHLRLRAIVTPILEPIDPFALLFRSGRLLATIEPDFNTLLK